MVTLLSLLWLLLMDTAPPKTKKKATKEGTEDDDDEEEEEEESRDPKIKIAALEEEKSRLWRKAKKFEKQVIELLDRIKELEKDSGLADDLRSSRLETAFLHAVLEHGQIGDVETTWALGNTKGFLDTVQVNDAGEVEGMDEAFDKLLDHYPWLADEPPIDPPSDGLPGRRTASPPRKQADNSGQAISQGQLKDRFPALRKHAR